MFLTFLMLFIVVLQFEAITKKNTEGISLCLQSRKYRMHPTNKTCDLGEFIQTKVEEMLSLSSILKSRQWNTYVNGSIMESLDSQELFCIYGISIWVWYSRLCKIMLTLLLKLLFSQTAWFGKIEIKSQVDDMKLLKTNLSGLVP